jgi:hypothetical protein
MNMKEIGWEGADKIHLTQVGSPWRAVVNISVTWLRKSGWVGQDRPSVLGTVMYEGARRLV